LNKVFTQILDVPREYGFKADDVRKRGGGIWYDHIHPTTRVHDILARELVEFLEGVTGVGTVATGSQ
jgi:phospholipase/lecithinase/hemolysin